MRIPLALLSACAALLAAALPATAEEPAAAGCTGFLWPLDTELAWMKAAEVEPATSGATLAALPAGKAIELALTPVSEVTFPVPPTSTPRSDDRKAFGGVVTIGDVPEGHYQITLSTHGWIDVAQNGKALHPTGHTGSKSCDVLRKSVRFEVGAGPATLEISGAPKDSIRIAIRPAAD